jgi:uncharacterized protein (TIGR02996 family)
VELPEPRPVLAGLLAEARERPEDAPRLVLADWLEDQPSEVDRARGEFIRLQCEIARIAGQDPRCADLMRRLHRYADAALEQDVTRLAGKDPVVASLRQREQELKRQYENVWVDVLRQQVRHVYFWRGLMRVEMRGSEFSQRLMTAIGESEHARWLEALRLEGFRGRAADRIFQSPLLAPLHELDLGEAMGLAFVKVLTASLQLTGLRALALHIDEEALEHFADSANWPCLTRLSLRSRGLSGQRTATALARASQLGRLTYLHLHSAPLGPKGMRALAEAPHLAGLEELNLRSNVPGELGLEALTGAFPRLRSLELSYSHLDLAGLQTLLNWPGLNRLNALNLTGNRFGEPGALALAESSALSNLTTLDLAACDIGPAGAAALATSQHLAGLRLLTLYGNPLGLEGARALARSPYLGNLALLWLHSSSVTADGMALLQERFADRLKT